MAEIAQISAMAVFPDFLEEGRQLGRDRNPAQQHQQGIHRRIGQRHGGDDVGRIHDAIDRGENLIVESLIAHTRTTECVAGTARTIGDEARRHDRQSATQAVTGDEERQAAAIIALEDRIDTVLDGAIGVVETAVDLGHAPLEIATDLDFHQLDIHVRAQVRQPSRLGATEGQDEHFLARALVRGRHDPRDEALGVDAQALGDGYGVQQLELELAQKRAQLLPGRLALARRNDLVELGDQLVDIGLAGDLLGDLAQARPVDRVFKGQIGEQRHDRHQPGGPVGIGCPLDRLFNQVRIEETVELHGPALL